MRFIKLYRYIRPDGGVSISQKIPLDAPYTSFTRIIADEEKALTKDGVKIAYCVDVESTEGWYEIDDPRD